MHLISIIIMAIVSVSITTHTKEFLWFQLVATHTATHVHIQRGATQQAIHTNTYVVAIYNIDT